MIQNVLPVVGAELNNYLKSQFDLDQDRLVLSNVMNQDGTSALEGSNKVVFSLINVEEESTLKAKTGTPFTGGSFTSGGPDIHLNLTVMFSAIFQGKNYVESLKFLSGIIYFFQSILVFNSSKTTGLSSSIDKVCFDILTMPLNELHSVFHMLGMKYAPSVLYKVRMLTFTSSNIEDEIPPISGLGYND